MLTARAAPSMVFPAGLITSYKHIVPKCIFRPRLLGIIGATAASRGLSKICLCVPARMSRSAVLRGEPWKAAVCGKGLQMAFQLFRHRTPRRCASGRAREWNDDDDNEWWK